MVNDKNDTNNEPSNARRNSYRQTAFGVVKDILEFLIDLERKPTDLMNDEGKFDVLVDEDNTPFVVSTSVFKFEQHIEE